jgi:hypothetical protein
MNQYIINELDIEHLWNLLKTDYPIAGGELVYRIRSHSYQSERDMVLDLLRPEVLHFALRMERKLRTHDDERGKDGWHEARVFWLLERLQQEVAELETGIEDFSKTSFSGECYDVGNFAMMIASKDLPCPSMDENIKNVIEELRQSNQGDKMND